MRLDKWLWHARFFKTRTLATRYVEKARCRVDGRVTDKAHASVAPGMVLTFALGPRVRIVRIRALGERRGPATEARALYARAPDPKLFWAVEGARHVDLEAYAPEEYRERVVAFLVERLQTR